MKVSIITVCYNSVDTIEDTILSVRSQSYPHIEHIVVDGGSRDGTIDVIRKYDNQITRWISEPDKGIYDAMNKGIELASGEVIGTLNADDFYYSPEVISEVVQILQSHAVEIVFGDVVFVDPKNLNRVTRTYSAKNWRPEKFAWGFMPPHPSCFVKRSCFHRYGMFKTDYEIASDYELLIRFLLVNRIPYHYLPLKMVKMRTGGVSTRNLNSNIILNNEIIRGCRENGIKTSYWKVYSKYFRKVFELM